MNSNINSTTNTSCKKYESFISNSKVEKKERVILLIQK